MDLRAVAAVNGRVIHKSGTVSASVESVWSAISTRDGVRTYFSPDARIEPVAGGAYEIYFHVFHEYGRMGGEGCRVMVVDPPRHLRHTWNAPTDLPEVRDQQTIVDWYLTDRGDGTTQVDLYHYGWERGGEWEQAFVYFTEAWDIIIGRLAARFTDGPVDWTPIVSRWKEAADAAAGAPHDRSLER